MMKRVRAVVVSGLVAAALIPAGPARGQGRSAQDTLRRGRMNAEELHRQRREALAAERSGLMTVSPPRYGSAVVGLPGAGRGTGTGVPPGTVPPAAGEVAVVCTGVMQVRSGAGRGGSADLVPGTFRGDCRPVDGDGAIGSVPLTGDGAYPGGYDGRGAAPGAPGYGNGASGYGRYGPYTGPPGMYGPWAGGVPLSGGEYYVSPFGGLVPRWSYGWQSGPAGAYAFSWPGPYGSGDCTRVRVTGPGGRPTEVLVGLTSLGLADPSDLDLSIDQRLSRGEVVTLVGLDGRVLRPMPGVPYEDIRVLPCDNETR